MPELRLELGGQVFSDWTSARVQRGLSEIAGSFELEYDDQLRMQSVLPRAEARGSPSRSRDGSPGMGLIAIQPLMEARILLDGELVLLGWVEDVEFELSGEQVRARLAGRDRTGFLVECSANPEGPAEYKGLTALEIASKLCAPFGIGVRAEVEVGAPLRDFGIALGESVMSAIDKAAKQRALLVTSDGVGGLVLTRSGNRRAPASLAIPGNAVSAGARLSSRDRFSDYWVKGQTRPSRGGRRAALDGTAAPSTARAGGIAAHSRRAVASPGPLDGAASPVGQSPPAATATATNHAAIVSTGHATDPAIAPYRPKVFSVRSQSGDAPNQLLAEWRMRIARGRSTQNRWTVAGWRDGAEDRLWRPNELVSIAAGQGDPYDALIAEVHYTQDDRQGSRTELVVVGREAYDLEPLPDQHRRHEAARGANVARGTTQRGTSSR